jgi:hypothetical protein
MLMNWLKQVVSKSIEHEAIKDIGNNQNQISSNIKGWDLNSLDQEW